MSNAFENPNGTYFVLINDEGQYSIWPAFLDIPSGWTIIYGEESQKLCLDYISLNWVDMRPNSLKSEIRIGKET